MQFPSLRNKRICLLIAHPDDEAMFFAPTLLALTRPETGNSVQILCLSSGDAEGLGEIRKKELVQSGIMLGLRKPEDITVVDRPEDFPDSMTRTWDTSQISKLLAAKYVPDLSRQEAAISMPLTATIDVLLTFDVDGVSGHPNHISLYHGAKAFVADLVCDGSGRRTPVDLYTLKSVSFLRKYTSVLDVFATLVTTWRRETPHDHIARPDRLVFTTGLPGTGDNLTAWRAMTRAHQSQMVWFRYGWITLSRFMVVNDLWLENKQG